MELIKKVYTSFNLHFGQLKNPLFHIFDSEAALPPDGREAQFAYAKEEHLPYYFDGEKWVPFGGGGMSGDVLTIDFDTPQQTWDIVHNCGRMAVIQTMDSEGKKIEGDIIWDLDDVNHITVHFSKPVMGKAVLTCAKAGQTRFDFSNSNVWRVEHGYNRLPLVQTMDSEGRKIEGDIKWDLYDHTYIEIHFSEPMSGTALLV